MDLPESILVPLLFLLYIRNVFLRISPLSEVIIFAYDPDAIISSKHLYDFCTMSNLVLSCISK